jgi:hypothetical protein
MIPTPSIPPPITPVSMLRKTSIHDKSKAPLSNYAKRTNVSFVIRAAIAMPITLNNKIQADMIT